jgi:hypothetical protein
LIVAKKTAGRILPFQSRHDVRVIVVSQLLILLLPKQLEQVDTKTDAVEVAIA